MVKTVNIQYENALTYANNPDVDVYYADTQPHLKLRVLPSAIKGEPEGRNFYYDYYWQGRRCRKALGQISRDNKSGITPAEARKLVMSYEVLRKHPTNPRHPLSGGQADIKGITLNNHFDTKFINDADIKPNLLKDGSRDGMLPLIFKQMNGRYNRHIRNNTIGKSALVSFSVEEIKEWFDNIRSETPEEALKSLNLAKHICSHLLENNMELANIIPNKFKMVKQKNLKKKLDAKREQNKSPMDSDEFKALWYACGEWHNPVEGLFIRFVMASVLRGRSVADLKISDVKKVKGKFQITKVMKKNLITHRLNSTEEKIFKDTLKARMKYPQPEDGYLFPKYKYLPTPKKENNKENMEGSSLIRMVDSVGNEPMTNDDIDRIFKGRKSKIVQGKLVKNQHGGIRGIASITEPTVIKYGLHDCRDTYASMDNLSGEDINQLLGHKNNSISEKFYTSRGVVHYDRISELRETCNLKLIS